MLFGEYIRLMALVEYSADEIKTVFSDFPDLEVCVYAAPTQTVIGGPPAQVDAIIERCESEGKFARKFQTKGASHTTQMDPLLGELAAELQGITAASAEHRLLLHRARGQLHPPGRRADPRRRLLEEGPAAQRLLHPRHPQRRRQRAHHVPGAGPEPGGAHAGRPDHGGGGSARRAADPDAGPQAGRGRVDGRGAWRSSTSTATTWTSRTLFSPLGPGDYADIPPTRFKRKEHWLNAHFSADGSSMIPGHPRRDAGRPPRVGVRGARTRPTWPRW